VSKIKRIEIKNFLGIDEFGLDAEKINIFKGPKGSGKSSIVEGIEKTFTNKNRRTEVIKHGTDEATLFVALDDGLEVDRRLRTDKADYLKVRKGEEGVPSTEKFLKSFINGDIFRPLDWVNKPIEEQTKSILSMLQIGWSNEDIVKWFGELPSNIDFNQHILQILKAIELKYYKDREEVNREIKELKTQIDVIRKDLPAGYDGELWKEKKVQDYYNKVAEAQKINQYIEQAKALKEGFKTKVQAIEANAESDKSRVKMKYKDQRQDIKDIIDISTSKIEKAKDIINNVGLEQNNVRVSLENEMEREIQQIKEKYRQLITEKAKEINLKADEQKDLIVIQQNKITQKTEELNSLDSLEKQELKAIDEKIVSEVDKEKIRVGKAAEYLENHEQVEVEPLQREADEVAEMQSYLRQWDMMISIRDGKLAEKERYSANLTAKIEKARELPGELLKTAKMPIEGISVDEKGLIRINGTLIDGLSDGEKLELAMTIAKAQAGELKVICLDRFESLKSEQKEILETALSDDYQYFITEHTDDTEMKIEKLGGNINE
jgi:DNA repair exonuclease SbcCD ATPase subunit